MTDRQFLWGLSGGISVFAIAGTFWFGLGIANELTPSSEWWLWAIAMGLQTSGCVGLLWAAARLRQRSRFRTTEFRDADARQRGEARRLRIGFGITGLAQAVLIGIAVWWCLRTDARDIIWPCIGLIVSLHFVPLARLFHVGAYYSTAFAGVLVSLAALAGMVTSHDVLVEFSISMAAVMWSTGAYLVWKAERIASRAVNESWAV